jgi:predicted nucleic acid-binding protein
MKNKAYDLSTYNFSKDETFLFDANVWLYLFPAPSDKRPFFAQHYSQALKKMLTSKVELALDAIILSEYLNRYCRIEYGAQAPAGLSFKDFRNSPKFHAVGKAASAHANGIAKLCRLYDHPFGSINLPNLLSNFETGKHDFNDGLLAHVCSRNKWKLVTHDKDFITGGIEVLTTNPKLLSACK